MKIIPKPVRQLIYRLVGPRFYENLRYLYYQKFVRDAGYDHRYYESGFETNREAYELLAKTLTAEFHPMTLVDVGCGNGGISAAFMRHGCAVVHAFDGSAASVEIARGRGLTDVTHLDFVTASEVRAKGDVCICCEVAEHIPEEHAAHFARILAKPAPVLVFTAAPPGQGGHLHVNLKDQSWWIDLMKQYEMIYDGEAVKRVRTAYAGKMIRDYDENLMIFRAGTT